MVDAIRQIRQELKTLTQAIATLATDLDGAYDEYLTALRTSIQKQVILACYHLCTHSYPERFLQLSFRQREAFQQTIQSHIHRAQQRLMNAYVLATTTPKPDETERSRRNKRQRSLPAADYPRSRSRRRSRDDDGDGPSIEFIAIGGDMDEEDMMAIADDPSLKAALSELADNLSLDRGEIADRIKRELLSKLADVESVDMDDIDEDMDDSDDVIDPEDDSPWIEDDNDTPDGVAANPSIAQIFQPTTTAPSAALSSFQMHRNGAKDGDGNSDSSDASGGSEPSGESEDSEPKYTKFAGGDELPMAADLLVRKDYLERNVAKILQDLSQQINQEFHQVGMIPRRLPEAVLEAALRSEASAEPSGGTPNVLSLVVEAEGKSKHSKVMRIKALNLRPSELEFSDTYLSACRSRLRVLTEKLKKMGKTYEKKQRSRAIAEAEAAWRSSWYERED